MPTKTMYIKADGVLVSECAMPAGLTWHQVMSRIQKDFEFAVSLEIGLVKPEGLDRYLTVVSDLERKRQEALQRSVAVEPRPQGYVEPIEPGDMGSNWDDQVEARHIARMKD